MSSLPPEYLQGVELFNQGAYFACHEVLEGLWQSSAGQEREFLHALIQAAVALYHERRGNEKGARGVYARARRKLASLPPLVMQLPVENLLAELDDYFQSGRSRQKLPRIELL